LEVWVCVGGGGGHNLTLCDFQMQCVEQPRACQPAVMASQPAATASIVLPVPVKTENLQLCLQLEFHHGLQVCTNLNQLSVYSFVCEFNVRSQLPSGKAMLLFQPTIDSRISNFMITNRGMLISFIFVI
jgi:hypothetical protein